MNRKFSDSAFAVSRFASLIDLLNRVPPVLFLFILLCINFVSPHLHPNEEHYFALAKQYLDPQWIKDSFSFTDPPETKILYYYITGFALKFLSFEQLSLLAGILISLLLSWSLARIFRLFRLDNIDVMVLLQIGFFPFQSFFAYEWIFGGFEPKSLAYVLLFVSLYFLLKEKNVPAMISLAAATWFHFLVAGWFFLVVFIYWIIDKVSFRELVRRALWYGIPVLPVVIILLLSFRSVPLEQDGVKYNWIITHFGNAVHLSPFLSLEWFGRDYLPGILLMLAAGLIGITVFRERKESKFCQLNRMNLIIMALVVLFIPVSYIDKEGFFMRFFPFRQAALALLFTLVLGAVFLREEIIGVPENIAKLQRIAGWLVLSVVVYTAAVNGYKVFRKEPSKMESLEKYVIENTQPGEVFLFFYPEDLMSYFPQKTEFSFSRKTRRDVFFSCKFIPYGGKNTYEWYRRYLAMKKLEKDIAFLRDISKEYNVHYVVTDRVLDFPWLKKVFGEGDYILYRIGEEGME
ncbi:MAG: hypothetical protein ACPLXM_13990 [Bacteroidales bacterium]